MIRVKFLKQMLAAIIALAALAIGMFVLRQAGAALVLSSQGADPASAFHEAVKAPVELLDVMPWLPDPERDGRAMEPGTRQSVTEAYASAWWALDRASRGDVEAPIDEYLSGPAKAAAKQAIADARRQPLSIAQLRQALELTFYSDDGSIVAFDVAQAEIVRVVGVGDDAVVVPSVERLKVVMLLEDGNWRVQQLYTETTTRSGIDGVDDPGPRRDAAQSLVGDPLIGANAVTPYQQDPTWTHYDQVSAENDLRAALSLGLNSLRIFVAGGQLAPEALANIEDFADRAQALKVRLVVTLLDGVADHSPSHWRRDFANVQQVVGALADHPAVALWDIKNEPDRDDDRSGGAPVVDAWLREIAQRVRFLDPATPTTIGWSTTADAGRVLDAVDVVSFHHFEDADLLRSRVAVLRPLIGDRPLFLSEFGSASWRGFLRGEAVGAQAADIYRLIRVSDELQLNGRMVWLLRDPPAPPNTAGGPWALRAELTYGIIEADGSPKPAALVVLANAAGPPPHQPIDEFFRSHLPYMAVAITLLFGILGFLGVNMRRRRRQRRKALRRPPTSEPAADLPAGLPADPTAASSTRTDGDPTVELPIDDWFSEVPE